jgi:hypothetical protein
MPGLRLTAGQVQRLCGIERMMCQSALDELVDGKFLSVKPDGTYARSSDGEMIPRPRAAKAYLGPDRRAKQASWFPGSERSESADMLWTVIAMTLLAGIAVLVVVIARRRSVGVDDLGALSDHWLAEHRVNSP